MWLRLSEDYLDSLQILLTDRPIIRKSGSRLEKAKRQEQEHIV